MKRLAASLLLIGTLSMTQPASAAWTKPKGPCVEPRYKITRTMPLRERQDRNRALIRCVFNVFAPSQVSTALYIADRESNFDPFAWNRSSDCRGTFQHMYRYWTGRVDAYLYPSWFPNARWPRVSAFHERANAIVTAKIVAGHGWGAWSTS